VHWREHKLGISDKETLRAHNNLGKALNWKNALRAADKYLEKALQRQKEILGIEHPSTLTSMANLAYTLKDQNQDDERYGANDFLPRTESEGAWCFISSHSERA